MIKYILAGGNDRESENYGQALAAEIFKTHPKPVHILSCAFASPREEWEVKFNVREQWFKRAFGSKTQVAMASPGTFRRQVNEADVIYLHGGDEDLIAYRMRRFQNLTDLFAGKIIVGSSAGAGWLANTFWTCDWREVRQGSGLAPLNIIPHYGSSTYGKDDPRGPIDWQKANQALQAAIGSVQVVTPLHEGQFTVVEQDN